MKMTREIVFKILTLLSICQIVISRDVYTATADTIRLSDTQSKLHQMLGQYIDEQEEQIRHLKIVQQRIADRISSVKSYDVEKYFYHPVNGFLMIRRLYQDLERIEQLTTTTTTNETLKSSFIAKLNGSSPVPDQEDILGSVDAILRLQDVYKLDNQDLINGVIRVAGDSSSIMSSSSSQASDETLSHVMQMTALDCYDLGNGGIINRKFHQAISWLNQSLNLINMNNDTSVPAVHVLQNLAFAHYKAGNMNQSSEIIDQIWSLELDSNDKTKPSSIEDYVSENLSIFPELNQLVDVDEDNEYLEPFEETTVGQYEKLCREGKGKRSQINDRKLSCMHWKKTTAFLKIAIIKAEQLSQEPEVYLFHDIISDREIEQVKSLAGSKLKRAGVMAGKADKKISSHRTSKHSWHHSSDHEIVRILDQRVEDITDLTVDTAENLQLNNYGIGGHFEPHHDFIDEEDVRDRIATWMYYLSDVESGGQTVFTEVDLVVEARKGRAVFWYNLYLNGIPDELSGHASCPVLYGDKWVANKWLREDGQEFRRKCGLRIDD